MITLINKTDLVNYEKQNTFDARHAIYMHIYIYNIIKLQTKQIKNH